MLLLLVMSTGDDWDTIMFWAMDSVGPNEPRMRNDSSGTAIFFIMWMFVGCFFAMQLFVGVVVDQFNRIRAEKDGSATMTEEQKQWVESMRTMGNTKLKAKPVLGPDASTFQAGLFTLLRSDSMIKVMHVILVTNICVLASDHWGLALAESGYTYGTYTSILAAYNYLFYLECLAKMYAFGPYFYWKKDDWTQFEGILVVLGVLNQLQVVHFISRHVVHLSPLLARALEASRALRALRLVQHAKGLHGLLTTIMMSIPSLLNVSSLLVLIVFIYSVLGVQLFTYIQRGLYFTHERNFDTFSNALLVNFQCLTGDGWSSLMHEALADEEQGSSMAIPFFVSFQVLCSLVILNLVVAVILDNFTSLGGGNSDLVSRTDIELFSEVWSDFDPDADHKIPIDMLPELMKAIPQPLGLQGAPKSWITRVCLNFGLAANGDGQLDFKDVLSVLVKFNFQQQMKDSLPPPSDVAAAAMKEAGQETVSKSQAGSSLLWSGEVTPAKRAVAKHFAMDLLRLSHGTSAFRHIVALPRDLRLQQLSQQVLSWDSRNPTIDFADVAIMAVSFSRNNSPKRDDDLAANPGVLTRSMSPADSGHSRRSPFDTEAPKNVLRRASVSLGAKHDKLDDIAVDATAAALTLYTRMQQRIATMNEQIQLAAATGDEATAVAMREQTNELRQQLVSNIEAMSTGDPLIALSPAPTAAKVASSDAPTPATPPLTIAPPQLSGALSYTGLALTFTLDGDLDGFTPEMERGFLERLAHFGGTPMTQLVVMKRRAGSVILEVAVLHSYDAPTSAQAFVDKIEEASIDEISVAIGCVVLAKTASEKPFAPAASFEAAKRSARQLLEQFSARSIKAPAAESPIEADKAEEAASEEALPEEELDPETAALWNVYTMTAGSDMDTAASASRVQAMFRGHKERHETSILKRQKTEGAEKMQAAFRGRHARAEVEKLRSEAAKTFERLEGAKAKARAEAEAALEQEAAKAVIDAAAARAAADARAAVEAEAVIRVAKAEAARQAAEAEAGRRAAEAEAARRLAEAEIARRAAVEKAARDATPPTAKPAEDGDRMLNVLQSRSDDFLTRLELAEERDTMASTTMVGRASVPSGAALDESRAVQRQRRADCRDCGICGICAVPRVGKPALPAINMGRALGWDGRGHIPAAPQGSSHDRYHRRPTGDTTEGLRVPQDGGTEHSRRVSSKRHGHRRPNS